MASAIAYPVPSFGTPSRPSTSSDVSVSSKKVRRRDVIRPLTSLSSKEDEAGLTSFNLNSDATPSAVASDEEATLNYADEASAVPSVAVSEAISAVNPQDSLMEGSSPSSVAHIGDFNIHRGRSDPSMRESDGTRLKESDGSRFKESVGSKAMVLRHSQRPPSPNSSPNSSRGAYREDHGVMVPHYSNYPAVLVGEGAEAGAMVVHSSSRPAEDRSSTRPGYSRASSDERRCFMVNSVKHSANSTARGGEWGDPRGVDPSEVIRDRSLVCRDGPSDPPGESPSNAPVVCLDIVPHNGEGASLGSRGGGNSYRKVKWVDPKTVNDEGKIYYSILKHYEDLASSSRYENHANSTALTEYRPGADPPAANHTSSKVLFHNPRMRIATISSGYKKANFFVREDLDTRIYFHNLEDAIGYMARRGYSKMRREEEDEWRELLGRAHGVVKRGPKKEKQRYRKGRLVLILKKTISDHDDADKRKPSKKSSKKKSKPKLLLLENGSATARSESSQTTDSFSTGTSTNNTNNTSRTSLGKSVRGPYKSYSEKFLAEQEEEKRQCMLAIAEGHPLPDAYGNDGGRLLLTDGTTAGTTADRVPVDPSEDNQSSQRSGSSFSRQSGETSGYSTRDSATSAAEYSSSSRHPKSVKEDFKKSAATLGSNRKGVYGGGVRYFTPDNVEDDESEESAEDEDFEEEEDAYDEVYSDSEEGTYDRSEESDKSDTIDCDGSDMGSMFGEEEETIDYTKGGVESVDGSASERDGDRKRKSSRGRRRDAPKMATIDDGSASSGSR